MNTQIEEKTDLKKLFDPLRQWVNSDGLTYEAMREFYRELQNLQKEFQNNLEFAAEIDSEHQFEKLYKQVAGENASNLIERLKAKGYAYKRDSTEFGKVTPAELNKNKEPDKRDSTEFGKAFESMGYRLLEQARAGKRSDVYYGILRIFVSYQKKFPDDLVEAFKPVHSIEMFKVFIFSFLSGIIGKEQQKENKN